MDLICVEGEKRLVADLTTDSAPTLGDLSYGEVVPLRIAKVRKAGALGANRWKPVDISDSDLRVALGNPLTGPTGGTFSIKWGGDQQGPLNWNFSAAQLGVALANIPALIADGGVTVSDQGNGLFYITFLTVGDKALFTLEDNALTPAAVGEVWTVVPGNGSTNEIQSFRIVQLPAVETDTFTASDPATATVTVIATGALGVNHKVTIELDPVPIGGFWTITILGDETDLLAYNITAAELEIALSLLPSVGVDGDDLPNVSVKQDAEGKYYLTFISNLEATDMGTITAEAGALEILQFMEGELDLRDIDDVRLLAGADSVSLFLEVEETPDGGEPIKLLRDPTTLVNPVLTVE